MTTERIQRLEEMSWLRQFWLFAFDTEFFMALHALSIREELIAYELCRLDEEALQKVTR